jgi:acid phosphatase type 7
VYVRRRRFRFLALSAIVGAFVLSQLVAASARPVSIGVPRVRGTDVSIDGTDPVIAAAGDIACDPTDANFKGGLGTGKKCKQMATSNLLTAGNFAAVLAVGDEQYECAGDSAFTASYGPAWGRVADLTYPAIGNHEYQTSGGSGCNPVPGRGYQNYFVGAGAPQVLGPNNAYYYSFDVGTWHLIALNANCSIVACKAGSTQEMWLKQDLLAHPNTCVLAYWHQPRFGAGNGKLVNNKSVAALWNDLVAAHADVVLNGHRHYYERLGKMDANGAASATGMRQWIVGTGGKSLAGLINTFPSTNERFDFTHYGVLELTLHPTSYDWSFTAIDGTVIDSGSDTCSV